MARVYKIGESGREITLYRIGPGESCILTTSCIMNGKPFPAFAVCEQAIEALIVNTADVMRWADEAPAWRNYLFSLVNEASILPPCRVGAGAAFTDFSLNKDTP